MAEDRFIPYHQLAQWKAAIKLEDLGMKHSSGRSVSKLVREVFGLSRSYPRAALRQLLQDYMDQLLKLAADNAKPVLQVRDDGQARAIDYNKEQGNDPESKS